MSEDETIDEEDNIDCVDCHQTVMLDADCEPTDPLLCHQCEKKRLRDERDALQARLDEVQKGHMAKLIELTAECLVDDAVYMAGPIESSDSERVRHNLVEENNDLSLYVMRLENGDCRYGTTGCKAKGRHDCEEVQPPYGVTVQFLNVEGTRKGEPSITAVIGVTLPFPYGEEHVEAAQRYLAPILNAKNGVKGFFEPCPVCKQPARKLWDNSKGCEHCVDED